MRLYFILICLILLPATMVHGGQASPIMVESDRMESVGGEGAILFAGEVVARQDGLVVYSDEMTVYYFSDKERAELPPGDERRLKQLFAVGNVRIETEEWVGNSQRLDYFEMERKILLSGNARVWQGNNLVTGETFTIYIDENKSVVERGDAPGERVRVFFYSGDDNGAAAPAPEQSEQPAEQPEQPAQPAQPAQPKPNKAPKNKAVPAPAGSPDPAAGK